MTTTLPRRILELEMIMDGLVDNAVHEIRSYKTFENTDRVAIIVGMAVVANLVILVLPFLVTALILTLTIRNYDEIPKWCSLLILILLGTNQFNPTVPLSVFFIGKSLVIQPVTSNNSNNTYWSYFKRLVYYE